jgi:uncharacterized protein YhaN
MIMKAEEVQELKEALVGMDIMDAFNYIEQLEQENMKWKANWERQKEKVNQVQGELNQLEQKYNDLKRWAYAAYSKLHSLRCSFRKGQSGYDETTKIIDKYDEINPKEGEC